MPNRISWLIVLAIMLGHHGFSLAQEFLPRLPAEVQRDRPKTETYYTSPLQLPLPELSVEKGNAGGEDKKEKKEEKKEEPEEWEEVEGAPLVGLFADGFTLRTHDEEYEMRIRVMEQTDFRLFVPGDQDPARTGFYIPRFRMYLEGHLTKPFQYELSLQRSVEGEFDVLDANLNFYLSEEFQVKLGRFLVPYSYDWYDHLEQFFITPERGLFPLNYGLSREAGLMVHGRIMDQTLQYATGGFVGQIAGVADNNTTRDWVGYLNYRPFLNTTTLPALQFLNVGGSVALGQQVTPTGVLPLRTAIQSSENDEAAQASSPQFLVFEEDARAYGLRAQAALHLAYYFRQLSFETEFQVGEFEYSRIGRPGRTGVPVAGYHVTMGYFLTGEEVQGRGVVHPLRPFDISKGYWGPGAWELFVRYSQLNVGREVFEAELANEHDWANGAFVVDLGCNWYLNEFIKFYFDWQHSTFNRPVLIDDGERRFSRHNDMFLARCQIFF